MLGQTHDSWRVDAGVNAAALFTTERGAHTIEQLDGGGFVCLLRYCIGRGLALCLGSLCVVRARLTPTAALR